jgi:hypothetical protein
MEAIRVTVLMGAIGKNDISLIFLIYLNDASGVRRFAAG